MIGVAWLIRQCLIRCLTPAGSHLLGHWWKKSVEKSCSSNICVVLCGYTNGSGQSFQPIFGLAAALAMKPVDFTNIWTQPNRNCCPAWNKSPNCRVGRRRPLLSELYPAYYENHAIFFWENIWGIVTSFHIIKYTPFEATTKISFGADGLPKGAPTAKKVFSFGHYIGTGNLGNAGKKFFCRRCSLIFG